MEYTMKVAWLLLWVGVLSPSVAGDARTRPARSGRVGPTMSRRADPAMSRRAGSTTSRRAGPTSSPNMVGDRVTAYKPGVRINWTRLRVELSGKVALRNGQLELFACATDTYGGDKTHESILLLEGRPLHIYQALGLIGLQPGRPARWEPKTKNMLPATGQPLELSVEWTNGGKRRRAGVSEWMRRIGKPDEVLRPLPWVFAGSARTPEGGILADEDGTVATTVDFDGSIIAVVANHPRDHDQLWIEARPDKVPPMDTPCTLIVRSAGVRLTMDRFGRVFVDRRRIGPDDLEARVRRELARLPNARITVTVDPTALKADIETLRKRLRRAGASDKAIVIERLPASAFPADDPDAGRAFLRDQLSLQRSMLESAQKEHQRLVDRFSTRHSGLDRQITAISEYIARLQDGLAYLAGDSSRTSTTKPSDEDEDVGPPHVPTQPVATRRHR